MKINPTKTNNIIFLEAQDVILTEIKKEGFLYDITYNIDPQQALKENAVIVNILTKPKAQGNQNALAMFDNENFNNITETILKRNSLLKDQIKSKEKTANVLVGKSDITTSVPNDKIGEILNFGYKTTVKKIELATRSDLERLNVEPPVLSADISVGNEQNLLAVQREAHRQIFNDSIDPSVAGSRNRTFATPRDLIGGLLTTTPSVNLVANAISSPRNNSNSILAVETIKETSLMKVKASILLPLSTTKQDEFYLVLDLVRANGITLESVSVLVSHSKNVAALMLPKIPPTLKLTKGEVGKVSISLKQNDPYAKGIALYKRRLNQGFESHDAEYTLVGKYKLTKEDPEKFVKDYGSNYNPVIYRAIPYGEDFSLSFEFDGAVSKVTNSLKNGAHFCVLEANVEEQGIRLDLSNISNGPCAFKIKRKELSTTGKQETWINNPILVQGKQASVLDVNVNKGKIYSYTVYFVFKTGAIEESASIIVDYKPTTDNIVNTTITNLVTTEDDVKFQINTIFLETDSNKIKQALEKQGLFGFFSQDLDRGKLQSLVAYKISRQNLHTGQEEEFGTTTNELFSDKEFGSIQNVSPVVSGVAYKYTVTTYLRQTETLFDTLTTTTSYSYKPNKWRHPITLNEGTLTSPESLKAYHANDTFTFGIVGKITSVTTALANTNPTIIFTNATIASKDLIKIQWKLEKPELVLKIDHFILCMQNQQGSRTIVGKTHNISDNGQFFFFDILDNNEKGAIKYTITPVYHDFSYGGEVETNTLLV